MCIGGGGSANNYASTSGATSAPAKEKPVLKKIKRPGTGKEGGFMFLNPDGSEFKGPTLVGGGNNPNASPGSPSQGYGGFNDASSGIGV